MFIFIVIHIQEFWTKCPLILYFHYVQLVCVMLVLYFPVSLKLYMYFGTKSIFVKSYEIKYDLNSYIFLYYFEVLRFSITPSRWMTHKIRESNDNQRLINYTSYIKQENPNIMVFEIYHHQLIYNLLKTHETIIHLSRQLHLIILVN